MAEQSTLDGVTLARAGLNGLKRGPERDVFYAAIVAARKDGHTLRAISEVAGVSQERVSQIVVEHAPEPEPAQA